MGSQSTTIFTTPQRSMNTSLKFWKIIKVSISQALSKCSKRFMMITGATQRNGTGNNSMTTSSTGIALTTQLTSTADLLFRVSFGLSKTLLAILLPNQEILEFKVMKLIVK